MKKNFLLISIAAVLLMIALAGGRLFSNNGEPQKEERVSFLMDTVVQIAVYSDNPEQAGRDIEDAIALMADLEERYSRHMEESEISRVNQAAGTAPVTVSKDTIELIKAALEYSSLSGGRFDITVAPLIDLWGFVDGNYHVPTENELKQVLELVDYTLVEIDDQQNTVYLPRQGMGLDLGAVAKGFIIDQGAEFLEEKGYSAAYVEAGGDMRLIGDKPGDMPWRIGIKHPRENGRLGLLSLANQSVVTSGDYERFFERGGNRYHHILDATTGLPARGLTSVTIVAGDVTAADALSTTVFLLGSSDGLALVESLDGVEALLVEESGEMLVSTGLIDIFTAE